MEGKIASILVQMSGNVVEIKREEVATETLKFVSTLYHNLLTLNFGHRKYD